MNLRAKSEKFLAVGSSGTGKTSVLLRLLYAIPADFIFVYDTAEGDYAEILKDKAIIVTTFSEFKDACMSHKIGKQTVIVFDSTVSFEGMHVEMLEEFCEWILRFSRSNPHFTKLFFVDELQQFVSVNSIPRAFVAIVEIGRKLNIRLLMASNNFNCLHARIRSQLTALFLFQMRDTTILEKVSEFARPDVIKKLPDLEDGQFFMVPKKGKTEFARIDLSAFYMHK